MPLVSGLLGGIGQKQAGQTIGAAGNRGYADITNATKTGQQGVTDSLNQNRTDINAAGDKAIAGVGTATDAANKTLGSSLDTVTGNFNNLQSTLDPYLKAGSQGINSLATYAASNPQFSFKPEDYFNSPAYQFQLEQGQKAIGNTASASGLANSGAAAKELTQFGQGLGATYYTDAFNRAQQTFQTNQNATLANLSTLANAGLQGSGLLNSATADYNKNLTGITGQQAQNTLASGYYGAGTTTDLAKYLATQGTAGSEFNANLGLEGAKNASDIYFKGQQGAAAGKAGMWNSFGNGVAGASGSTPGGFFGSLVGFG